MKTTDLIPILLYHLKDGEKYGLELVEATKSCSNGRIEIKQPTLYSVLKKLEKSRFISSYWEDSTIGGKRHYYKITKNGLSQLETYPPLNELVELALDNDGKIDSNKDDDSIINNIETSTKTLENDVFALKNDTDKAIKTEKSNYNPFDNFGKTLDNNIKKELEVENDISSKETESDDKSIENSIKINNEESIETIKNDNEIKESVTDIQAENKVNDYIEEPDDKSITKITEPEKEEINLVANETAKNADISPIEDEKPSKSFDIFDVLGDEDDNQPEIASDKANKQEIMTSKVEDEQIEEENTKIVLENPFFKETKDKKLNEKANLEINEENAKILKGQTKEDNFVNESSVATFTKKEIRPPKQLKITPNEVKTQPSTESVSLKNGNKVINDIPYRDYVNFKTDAKVNNGFRNTKIRLFKILTSSIFSILLLIFTFCLTVNNKITSIYVVFSLSVTLYVVLYACSFIGKYKQLKVNSINIIFTYNYKKQIVIRSILFGIILLTLLIINIITPGITKMFLMKNFGSLLAPILISSLLFTDYLFAYIFYRKII